MLFDIFAAQRKIGALQLDVRPKSHLCKISDETFQSDWHCLSTLEEQLRESPHLSQQRERDLNEKQLGSPSPAL